MTEATNDIETTEPETSGQVEATSAEKWLSLMAIVLFILFVLARMLDWADFRVVVSTSDTILPNAVGISGSAAWDSIGTPLILCALALIPINLFFMFTDRALDPLAPALANCVVGVLLVAATIYFIVNTDGVVGGARGKAVILTYDPTTGAYVALAIAAAMLIAGIVQLRMRFNE